MQKSIGDFINVRKNNFTLIRLILAWAVLYGHSYALHNPKSIRDPLNIIFQGSTYIGTFAVCGFFVLSGYLVSHSLVNRGVLKYAIARLLRIFPGLIICILLSVFVLGPLFTTLNLSEYFNSNNTYTYLINMFAMGKGLQYDLPGVFLENRRSAVNGSLWSIPLEVRCYILLAFTSVFGLFSSRSVLNFSIVSIALLGYTWPDLIPLVGRQNKVWNLPPWLFLVGVFFYNNRDSIPLNGKLAIFAIVSMLYSFGNPWFEYSFPFQMGYLIFYISYCTRYIEIEKYIGDLSYGIYIYAYPIQQIIADLFSDRGPLFNVVLSSLIVFPLAYCSWFLIEKPSVKFRHVIFNKLS